jgi:hypothetical protein
MSEKNDMLTGRMVRYAYLTTLKRATADPRWWRRYSAHLVGNEIAQESQRDLPAFLPRCLTRQGAASNAFRRADRECSVMVMADWLRHWNTARDIGEGDRRR